MSSALLRFQPLSPPKEMPLDLGILAAALNASPEPMAVTENGKLLYANRSFAPLETLPTSPADCSHKQYLITIFLGDLGVLGGEESVFPPGSAIRWIG